MTELDKFIKKINLVFTDTLKKEDFCKRGFTLCDAKINYEDTISFYHFVSSFNKLYLLFKNEYEKLDKIDFVKEIEEINFIKTNSEEEKCRILTIYIDKPNQYSNNPIILYLMEKNTQMYSFITEQQNPYNKHIDIDCNKIKNYLDLFEKYESLFETYHYLKNQFVLGDGTHTLFTTIDNNLTTEHNYLKLKYGINYFNTFDHVKLCINLGSNFSINYNQSNIILDSEIKEMNEETANKLLKNTYIHKKYLKLENNDMYK